MSGVEIKRDDLGVSVEALSGGVSARVNNFALVNEGRCSLNLDLGENDEVTLHNHDLEIWLDTDRLSDLHEMLGAILREVKTLMRER